jgi:predicted nucleic acid-binding protein
MILVDSSVWIDHLNAHVTAQVQTLRWLIPRVQITVGDLILCEILQGLDTEQDARAVEGALRQFPIVSITSPALAISAAANYRSLRRRGITIRRTIDLLIGTFCIDEGYSLLHADRDFEPMERYLGLRTV